MANDDLGAGPFSNSGARSERPQPRGVEEQRPEQESATPSTATPAPAVAPQSDFGKEIAARMKDKGYHPVVIAGTTFSGKSSLLTSLFGYIQSVPGSNIGIRIGEPLVPTNTAYGEKVFREATNFLDVVVYEFMQRRAAQATRFEYPFYIPVILTQRGSETAEPRRFAFLEGQGEWYNPVRAKVDGDRERLVHYQDLREEVASVLRHFPYPISLIYVAPYTTEVSYRNVMPGRDVSQKQENANLALKGMLDAYEDIRTASADDRHLFVLSKWDVHTEGVQNTSFAKPEPGEIVNILQQRFRESWTRFQNMHDKGAGGTRFFMQYSAGPISDDSVIDVRDVDFPNLHRYPRTVLNWLWGNATGGEVLYPDVIPQPPRRLTVLEKITRLVG